MTWSTAAFEVERIFDLIAWSKACSFAPFVRVPQGLYHFLARVMDAGALGVMVGNVETPEQAESIVNAVKYAPMGKRGVALGDAHTDYVMPDRRTNISARSTKARSSSVRSNRKLGSAMRKRSAAAEGVDWLWVGHYDLSQSMGIPAQFHHEQFLEALRTVVTAARKHGPLLGIQPGSTEQADEWMALGFNVISWSSDIAVYRTALESSVKRLRQHRARYA